MEVKSHTRNNHTDSLSVQLSRESGTSFTMNGNHIGGFAIGRACPHGDVQVTQWRSPPQAV